MVVRVVVLVDHMEREVAGEVRLQINTHVEHLLDVSVNYVLVDEPFSVTNYHELEEPFHSLGLFGCHYHIKHCLTLCVKLDTREQKRNFGVWGQGELLEKCFHHFLLVYCFC